MQDDAAYCKRTGYAFCKGVWKDMTVRACIDLNGISL